MIGNRLIALAILIILIAGTILYLIYQSLIGPVLTIAGVFLYFVFNKKEKKK